MPPDPKWVRADRAAARYHAATGLPDSETVRKNAARVSMTVKGDNRLVKVVPLIGGDAFPPGLEFRSGRCPKWPLNEAH